MSEILCRLNAKAGISEGFGGIPDLTTSDIAAALAGANKAGVYLLLAKDCGLPELTAKKEYKAICGLFYPEVHKLAKRLKWRLHGTQRRTLDIFTDIVVADVIAGTRCPSCRGTKYSLINPSNECRTCRGTGVYVIPDKEKARQMGISPSAYCKNWVRKEPDIKSLLERRIYQAEQSIYRKLHGEL